jgi:hypothetical protein
MSGTRIGIGLSQYYNIYEEFSPRDYIIMSNTDTDNVKIKYYEKTMIVRGSLLSQSIKHVLANNDILTLGVKYNHYRLYGDFQFFGDNYKCKFYSQGFSIGLRYDSNYKNDLKYSIAFNYEKGTKLRKQKKSSVYLIRITPENDTLYYRFFDIGIIPDKIDLGTIININKLSLVINSSFVFWQNYSYPALLEKDDLKNQLELNGSLIYKFTDAFKASIGFFKTNYSYIRREESGHQLASDPYFAIYLTSGFVLSLADTDIDVAVADSHISSDKIRKQTIFKIGINYNFND